MTDSGSSISSSDSSNPELCELKERIDIVDRYDKGLETEDVDDWENPNFEIYTKTDRYGFMHEDESQLVSLTEEKVKEIELKRESKWIKMITRWDKYKHSVKLRRRVFKGIPEKFRSKVWSQLLDIGRAKQPGVYEQLRFRARLLSKDLKQIDLDINRTYRNHIFFRQRYDGKQRDLFHVLAAYAIYNTQVGYCQGMSQVAAVLLMYLTEEDAFWALHTLMCDEKYAMHGFFVPGFPKLLRFQQHHDKILHKMLPKLKKHFDKQEIYSGLYTTKWFFQCFLDRVPFTLALRFWDNFILDGDIILTGGAYCILKMHQKGLYKMNFEQVMNFLQIRLEKDFGFDPDDVVRFLRLSVAELKRHKLIRPSAQPDSSELPSVRFGAILQQPLDRTVSSVLSRKIRHSKAPSISQSTPATPRNRSPTTSSPVKVNDGLTSNNNRITIRPQAITTIYVAPKASNNNDNSTSDNSAAVVDRSRPCRHSAASSRDSRNDDEYYNFSPALGKTTTTTPDDRRQLKPRDAQNAPLRNITPHISSMRHVLSVYDNIDPAEWSSSEGRSSSMSSRQDQENSQSFGSSNVKNTRDYVWSSTTYEESVTESSVVTTNDSHRRCPSAIYRLPNHVTTVEVDPDAHKAVVIPGISYADPTGYSRSYYEAVYGSNQVAAMSASPVFSAGSSSYQTSLRNASTSPESPLYYKPFSPSSTMPKPAKFPVSSSDYNSK